MRRMSLSELTYFKKKKRSNTIKWLGFNLTKKKAYYLLIFSIISEAFFTFLMFNAFWVLLNTPTIYQYNTSIYYQILLLGFSNLIISLIFIGISGYSLKQIRIFRKFSVASKS